MTPLFPEYQVFIAIKVITYCVTTVRGVTWTKLTNQIAGQ